MNAISATDTGMTPDEMLCRLNAAFAQLDDTEQMIFLAGARGLATRALTMDQFTAWTQERIDRHRAGEQLRVSDLETPPAPPTGLP